MRTGSVFFGLCHRKTDRPHCLHGIAEADELYVLESQKGARTMTRPARRRACHATLRGISHEHVCILLARDRTGQTLDFVTGMGALTKAQLHRCLPPVMDQDVLLVSDGHAASAAFCPEGGHQPSGRQSACRHPCAGRGPRAEGHAYHSRLRQWLGPFHGVATRYLQHYLAWRWILDARRIGSAETLLKATLGEFPHLTVT